MFAWVFIASSFFQLCGDTSRLAPHDKWISYDVDNKSGVCEVRTLTTKQVCPNFLKFVLYMLGGNGLSSSISLVQMQKPAYKYYITNIIKNRVEEVHGEQEKRE